MYALGIAYANGFGVEYCPEKAFGYFSKAAEQGIVGASLDLGKMYFHGTGVEQSYQKARDALAFEWYYLAMSNGHTEAKVKLAIMFANGHGTEKDSFAASSLLSDAVDEGSRLAIDLENCF